VIFWHVRNERLLASLTWISLPFGGYMLGAALMLGAAVVELVVGVACERQSLEDIAAPLSTERPNPVKIESQE